MRESFTAMTGNRSTPAASIDLRRITPVVVSSVEARTPFTTASRAAGSSPVAHSRSTGCRSSYRSSPIMWSAPTTSAPSSIVTSGRCWSAARMWR